MRIFPALKTNRHEASHLLFLVHNLRITWNSNRWQMNVKNTFQRLEINPVSFFSPIPYPLDPSAFFISLFSSIRLHIYLLLCCIRRKWIYFFIQIENLFQISNICSQFLLLIATCYLRWANTLKLVSDAKGFLERARIIISCSCPTANS